MTNNSVFNDDVTVFVYGSLKKGLGNHSFMTDMNATFIGYDIMSTEQMGFTMISYGGFPAVCYDSNAPYSKVYGQVYKIPADGLKTLDALEGHPRWYKREKLRTDADVRAWIYLMPQTQITPESKKVQNNLWKPSLEELTVYKTSLAIVEQVA